jgi:hypothetical protein
MVMTVDPNSMKPSAYKVIPNPEYEIDYRLEFGQNGSISRNKDPRV